MAFKIQLLSDVAGFLRGTTDVEKALDDVADSLDDLARETKQNADKAADSLEREFSDAMREVRQDADKTGRKMGDDLKHGTREAGEGFDDLKDEANESAREAAASFSGEFEDVADYIQEVLAQALSGFGPLGAAAGIAAAAGIGMLIGNLQDSAEKAEEAKDRVLDLAEALEEANGNPAALRWADILRTKLREIVNTKEWYEFWQDEPKTRLQEWSKAAEQFGVSMEDVGLAQTGNADAQKRFNDAIDQFMATKGRVVEWTDAYGVVHRMIDGAGQAAERFRQEVNDGGNELQKAQQDVENMATSLRGINNQMGRAAEASATFTDSLNDHLSVADEGLDRFVKNGKLALDEWSNELARRAKEAKTVQDFTVDIAPKLSPEALARFAELPVETQLQIARAFKSGSGKDRQKIRQNLEAEAKVTKVDVNTQGAQTEASKRKIEFPTTVVEAGAVKGAQQAADKAQRVASSEGNKIEYHTKLNSSGLQGDVNRAAAGITPPVIWATVKAKKAVE